MAQSLFTKCFTLELTNCSQEEKELHIQTLTFFNVISFSCVCVVCNAKFNTFHDVQTHMNTEHFEADFTYAQDEKEAAKSEDKSEHDESQISSKHTATETTETSNQIIPEVANADVVGSIVDSSTCMDNGNILEADPCNDFHNGSTSNPGSATDKIGAHVADVGNSGKKFEVINFTDTEITEIVSSIISPTTDLTDEQVWKKTKQRTPPSAKKHPRGRKGEIHTCSECSATFYSRPIFEEHCKEHPDYKPFTCEFCGITYAFYRGMMRHVRVTHLNPSCSSSHECPECGKAFSRLFDLGNHIKGHPWYIQFSDKPYQCTMCEEAFISSVELESHALNHSDFKPFHCLFCGSTFGSRDEFREHVATHPSGTLYTCPDCDKEFKTVSAIRKHLAAHTKYVTTGTAKRFPCNVCGKVLSASDTLKNHMNVHSGAKPFECETCGAKFTKARSLRDHRNTHLAERPYRCTMCPKAFTRKFSLTLHVRWHSSTTRKSVSCPECEKGFRKQSRLDMHIKLRHRQHTCNTCARIFSSSAALERHNKMHSAGARYQCDKCGSLYADNTSLARHYLSHTGEKPHACKTCRKRFPLKESARRCEIKHTSKRVQCTLCKQAFIFNSELRKHMRVVHPAT